MDSRWRGVAVLLCAVLVVSCSAGDDEPTGAESDAPEGTDAGQATTPPATIADEPVADPDGSYAWRRVPLGPGGFVTGLVAHPSEPGIMFARTDIGGAYRYDATTERWDQLVLTPAIPADGLEPEDDDYQVEAIGLGTSDPRRVYLVVGADGNVGPDDELPRTGRVLRSDDGGVTWTAGSHRFFVSGNQEYRQQGERISVDPNDADHVVLGTRREGVWTTHDGGDTWAQVPDTSVPTGVRPGEDWADHAGVTFTQFVGASIVAGVAGAGVYRSDDDGRTWALAHELDEGAIPRDPAIAADTLWFVVQHTDGANSAILRLRLGTGEVEDVTPPDRDAQLWAVAVDAREPERMLAVADAVRDDALYRSTNGGEDWRMTLISIDSGGIPWLERSDIDGWMSIGKLVFDPTTPDRVWFAEGMGVWRADAVFDDPDDVRWVLASDGIEQLAATDVLAVGGAPISLVADRQGFLHEDLAAYPERTLIDERFAGGADIDYVGSDPDTAVWIGAEYHIYWEPDRGARGAITRDGGRTWDELANLDPEMFSGNVAVSATDPSNIVWLPSYMLSPWEYEDQPRGLWATKDLGENWTHLPDVAGSNRYHRLSWWTFRQALSADKVDGGVFYLYDDEGRFVVSTDGGFAWTLAPHAPPCSENNECHVFGQLRADPRRAGTVWASVGTDGLYRTSDRGATEWQRLPGVDEARSYGFGAPVGGSDDLTIYLHGRVGGDPRFGIWRSADDGMNWELIGRYPLGIYQTVSTLSGDLAVPGRVYVGFSGTGLVYGEPLDVTG